MKSMQKPLLALVVPTLMTQIAYANQTTPTDTISEEPQDLGVLQVTVEKKSQAKLGETVIGRQTIQEELISNSEDLVRYNNEVDVAQTGRYGNKGFAVRGVDGNRVNVSIDGVGLPEVEVNEIFSPYGYMYEGRFNPDVEMMSAVKITAGADSLKSGSGAVGGAVNYTTKNPASLLTGDDKFGGYAKVGYQNKNDGVLTAVGLAGTIGQAQLLLNYAHREGKETKNHAMRQADSARLSPLYVYSSEEVPTEHATTSLIYPDPLKYQRDSVLAKAFYTFNDTHKIGLNALYQKQQNHMNTDSKNATTGSRLGSTVRRAKDIEKMQGVGVSYHYTPSDHRWLDSGDIRLTHNEFYGLADTWIYGRKFDYDDNWNIKSVTSASLSNREYRPTTTTANQLNLSSNSKNFDFGKLGEHTFDFKANYIKQDYKNSAYSIDSPSIPNHLAYAFPDAKKTIYNLSIVDDIYINDKLNANIGVRYDNFLYKPYYEDNSNAMLSENVRNYEVCIKNEVQGVFCDAYRSGGLKNTKFKNTTWSAMANYNVIDNKLTARYKIGTGFLAPTVAQVYSSFSFNDATQIPNYSLKPETSLNQEIEFEYKPIDTVILTASGYLSQYKDFIHTKYWEYNPSSSNNNGCVRGTCLQSINLDEAKIYGMKLGAMAELSPYFNTKGRINAFANYHISKDSAMIETDKNGKLAINTLAAVPNSLLIGGSYTSANDDWQVNARINLIGRKKAEDTKNIETVTTRERIKLDNPSTTCIEEAKHYGSSDESCYYNTRLSYEEIVRPYKYIDKSQSVVIYDLYGSKKFGKDKRWIFNAGIYNISNEKYIPWETLRQFATTGINAMVDGNGYGFARYTAPGRNYAMSLTYEF